MSDAHRTYAWVKARKARLAVARANGEHCIRCGKPIDYTLSGNARHGPTVDHLDPLQLGGVDQHLHRVHLFSFLQFLDNLLYILTGLDDVERLSLKPR